MGNKTFSNHGLKQLRDDRTNIPDTIGTAEAIAFGNPHERTLSRKHTFNVRFPIEFDIPETSIVKINSPKLINDEWENITIIFHEFTDASTTRSLMHIHNFIESLQVEYDREPTIFSFNIEILNFDRDIIATWLVHVQNVLEISFGELNYDVSEFQEMKMVVEPWSCELIF